MTDKLLAPWAKQKPEDMALSLRAQDCLEKRREKAQRKEYKLEDGAECGVCGAHYDVSQDRIIFSEGDCFIRRQ